jgi:ubiquinone/menaquinone biosynthesis C-methylase UbiE
MVNQNLFIEFLRVYAFQPATGFWRAVEVELLKKFLPLTGTCLDLGCGDGKLTSILYDGKVPATLNLIGIDNDSSETSQASTLPFYKRIHTCSASNIPEDSSSFDHAFSNSVLEHIQDIEATLAEVSRVLKPGGTFVFTVPSSGFHKCLYGPLNRKASRKDYLKEMDKRLAHYRYWSVEEWLNKLSKSGMVLEQTVDYFNCSEVQRWENISRFTAGIIYALGRRKNTPIEAQKKLGLRQAQNRIILPRWLARLLASFLSFGVKNSESNQNACLLILARKKAGE